MNTPETSQTPQPAGRRRTRRARPSQGAPAGAGSTPTAPTAPTAGSSLARPARRRRDSRPATVDTPVPAPRPRAAASPRKSGTSTGSLLRVEGVLRVHPRGFGFVTPETSGVVDGDVFVPGPLLKGLFDNDRIEVFIRPGDTQARRTRLLGRGRDHMVGVVSRDGRRVEVDPGVGTGSLPLTGKARAGEVVRFALDGTDARVVEVLGSPTDPAVAKVRFLDRHRLPDARPAAAEREVRKLRMSAQLGGRRDLRDQLVITIDDDSSRDLDDALAARLDADGSIRLWVHIADVSEYVLPGSALDRAAAEIPTSVYLPQGVRHMLPESLAAERLSLLPGVERDTLCVEFRLDPEGAPRGVDIYEARIRSSRRVNYQDAADVLEGRPGDLPVDVVELLRVLRTAACRLDLGRAARGGLDSMRADQDVSSGSTDEASHRLVERLMVATNEMVAGWLTDRGMPVMWRAHDPLSQEQVAEVERVARGFGVVAGLGSPVSARSLAVTAAQVPQGPAGSAFWDALLGVLGRAYYTVERAGHFGLASPGYLHFTSPLRRYPDLLVHRVVKAYLRGDRDPHPHHEAIASAAPVANDVFQRASRAERDATLAVGLAALSPGQEVSAFVVGRARNGVRLRLSVNGVPAIVSDDLRPGERVQVRVVAVDPQAGRLEVKLTERPRRSSAR